MIRAFRVDDARPQDASHPATLNDTQEKRIAALERELWNAMNAMALEVYRCQRERRTHRVMSKAIARAAKVFNG